MSEHTPESEPPSKKKEPRLPPSRDPQEWLHRPIDEFRNPKYQLDYRPSDDFFDLADFVMRHKRTLLAYDRLYIFWQAAANLANVPGSVAEIGSYRGGSAYFIASAFLRMTGSEVPMHVFDTFEGHPAESMSEHDPYHSPGQFQGTQYEKVREYLSRFTELRIHKGDVLHALPQLEESVYRLVHIDTDLYQPTVACLDYFGPRMSPEGVIVVDDYASKKCPGVPKAVSEYLARTDQFRIWDMRTEQLVLIKR
jgi:O-methyltransferase